MLVIQYIDLKLRYRRTEILDTDEVFVLNITFVSYI